MKTISLSISPSFRKMAYKAVWSIVTFFILYLSLVILAIGLICFCGFLAYWLVMSLANFITVMLGLGLVGMGFMIFFFLIKFVLSSHVPVDRSHLMRITKMEQPELFQLLEEMVTELGTGFPKNVYLTYDVNAAVFYDSTFWSMFLPVRKNLQIGMGLITTVSEQELKAILAHEFGHFSQKSMKLGSYVHHVNKVLHNLLYDNQGYANLLHRWGNVSSYFGLFSHIAVYIITQMQAVLRYNYQALNLTYMALSREMEFHADAIAAHFSGAKPLVTALLRSDLASQSFTTVLNYYDGKVSESLTTKNIYPQQYYVLNYIAQQQNLTILDGLPILSVEDYKRFNKTGLVLDDQWSSHPSMEDRAAKLNALVTAHDNSAHSGPATKIFRNPLELQEQLTAKLSGAIQYPQSPDIHDLAAFSDDFVKSELKYAYPEIFKGYFDTRTPFIDFTSESFERVIEDTNIVFSELINDEAIAMIFRLGVMTKDLQTIENIENGTIDIQTFDYDGRKYHKSECILLIQTLKVEIDTLNEILNRRDKSLFDYFLSEAQKQARLAEFKARNMDFQEIGKGLITQQETYLNFITATSFMHTTTSFEDIEMNMFQVKRLEKEFKIQISRLIEQTVYCDEMSAEQREQFVEYLSGDLTYFGYQKYNNENVTLLFNVINNFYTIVSETNFKVKKDLLAFEEKLQESVYDLRMGSEALRL